MRDRAGGPPAASAARRQAGECVIRVRHDSTLPAILHAARNQESGMIHVMASIVVRPEHAVTATAGAGPGVAAPPAIGAFQKIG